MKVVALVIAFQLISFAQVFFGPGSQIIFPPETNGKEMWQYRPTDYLNQNGSFGFHGVEQSNPVGTRRNDTAKIGWNLSNEAAGKGFSGLVFESRWWNPVNLNYQAETYLMMSPDGGPGHRPWAFNMDSTNDLVTGILSADFLHFKDNVSSRVYATIDHSGFQLQSGSIHSNFPDGTDWIKQAGVSLIRLDAGYVNVSPAGNVRLGTSLPGSYVGITAQTFKFLSPYQITGSNDKPLVSFGTHAGGDNYVVFSPQNTGTSPEIKVDGIDADINLVFRPKGNGRISLQTATVPVLSPVVTNGNRELVGGSWNGSSGSTKVTTTPSSQRAGTGTVYACFDTSGDLIASATPCSGTLP